MTACAYLLDSFMFPVRFHFVFVARSIASRRLERLQSSPFEILPHINEPVSPYSLSFDVPGTNFFFHFPFPGKYAKDMKLAN